MGTAGEAELTANEASADARCVVCGALRTGAEEHASVRCNVRAFVSERFDVWRCTECRSIHAAAPVDLDHYYKGYPVLAAELDWRLKVVYGGMLRRLVQAGLKPDHRILDYGCGRGPLVRFLRARGYPNTAGYDRYGEGFSDASVLDARYDCIVSQDLIEHVDDPIGLLGRFDAMADPNAIISIGTPDAEALDLADAENYVHALHQPYHRHILAASALKRAGVALGWEITRYYDTMYNNTWFPTMNPRFVLHYVRANDDVFDLVAEPVKVSWKFWSPVTPFLAVFGHLFDRHTDIQVVFRKKG